MIKFLVDPTVIGWVLVMVSIAIFGAVHQKVSWGRLWEGGLAACSLCQSHTVEAVVLAIGVFVMGLAMLPFPYDFLWGVMSFIIFASLAMAARVAAFSPVSFTSSESRQRK